MERAIHESNILELSKDFCYTTMGSMFLKERLQNVTSIPGILQQRTNEIMKFRKYLNENEISIENDLQEIKAHEEVLKDYVFSETADAQIFFTSEHTKSLNGIPFLLAILLILKIYITPILALLTPVFMIMAPYFILRFVMNMEITWDFYVILSKQMFLGIEGNEPLSLKHYGQFVWFCISTIQTITQPFLTAINTKKMDDLVLKRGNSILEINRLSQKIKTHFDKVEIHTFSLPELPLENRRAVAVYDEENLVRYSFGQAIGKMDMIFSIASSEKWSPVNWLRTNDTYIEDFYDLSIKNPVKNTFAVKGHSLLTGPNRGGKSSVLRGLLQQIVLAQTIGMTLAKKFSLKPYDWIHSRLQNLDIPGHQSLFEQEVYEVANLLKTAENPNKSGLVFIDELFHSTNPPDAEFSATVFLDKLWKSNNVQSIISTHTFSIVKKSPKTIRKICVFATEDEAKNITYSYTLKDGECYVSSALDVLKEAGLC